jgi:hypothetical protein
MFIQDFMNPLSQLFKVDFRENGVSGKVSSSHWLWTEAWIPGAVRPASVNIGGLDGAVFLGFHCD